MAAPIGKLGKAGKAVLMSKTSHLRVVHDHYAQAPGPGELLVHNVYSSVNPVDCYMHSGAYKVQFLPKVRRAVSELLGCLGAFFLHARRF